MTHRPRVVTKRLRDRFWNCLEGDAILCLNRVLAENGKAKENVQDKKTMRTKKRAASGVWLLLAALLLTGTETHGTGGHVPRQESQESVINGSYC